MAGYCGYCGTPLDKNGLCPNCGNEDEATGLLTPGDMPAFYTEGQGALFGGGPASDAEPEQTPYSYPVVDPRPTLDGPPVYPGSGYGAQQGYARQDPAPGPDRVAYAAPQPEKQPKRATPKKPSKGGRGKKIALIVGSCVLGVALIIGLLFAFGVIRLKSDPLVGEVYFLVTPAEHIQTDADTGLRYADNELLVVARTGVKKRDMETVAKKYHAAVVGFIEVTGDYQLQLEEPLSKDDLEQLSVTIASEPEVASAEPNRVVTLRRTAAAPANEKNETPAATPETYWNLRQIRAYEAWTTVNAHENEIKPVAIGMISDGAPTGHKDIPLKESFFESNGDVGHALAVAGIMAADGTNADGFSGVYPYANGRLFAASTEGMQDSGVSVMWEKAAIAKLLVSGVKVLNCGYGTEMTDFLDLTAAADTLGDYLDRSLNAGYDFLLVAPAPDATGESTLSAIDGAKYPNVRAHILTTGGSDEDGQPLASGSHDLIAPQGKETAIYSAVPGGYGFVGNDASLAAPHVSGAAALVWSVDENLTGDAVRRILIHTAQANRLLDVNAAVTYALENKGKDVPAVNEPTEPEPEDDLPENAEVLLPGYEDYYLQEVHYQGDMGNSETIYTESGLLLSAFGDEDEWSYEYDEYGRIKKQDIGWSHQITEFTYSPYEGGSQAKGISHDSYSPDIEIRVTLTYNADNLLIREEQETDYVKNDVHHEYYSNGNKKKTVHEYTSLSPDGSSYTSTTEYDGIFDVRIRDRYESDGSVRETEYTNIHGIEFCVTIKKDGKIVREDKIVQQTGSRIQTETYENGEHTFSTVFELDRNGYIVSSVITSMRKPEKPYKTFQYTYDQYGHLIRSVEKLDEFTTRTADYIWTRRTAAAPGTQSPTTSSPQTQVKVVAAYEKSGVDQTGFGYSWSIPKIEGGSGAFDRINQEIWKTYYDGVVNEGLSALEKGTSVTSPEISYQWAINGDILSLLVIHHYLDPSSDYLLYNVSVSTGKDVSRSDILKYKGLSDDAYTLKVRQAIGTALREGNPDVESWKDADMIKSFNACLTNSLSDKNVSEETRPYLNDKGQLCIAAKVYSVGGAPYYLDYINTETIRVAEDYDRPVTVPAASADGNTIELTFTTEQQDYTISGGNNITVSMYYDLVVASGSDAAAVKRVNDFFRADFQDYLDGLEREGYFRDYLDLDTPYRDVTLQNTTEFVSVWHKHDVISVEMGSSWFMGGVFNGGTYGLNIDVKTGRAPDLAALFMNGDSNALLTRLKQALTTFLTENGSAREAGSVGSFTLEDFHYVIRDDELILWLAPYELMPGGWSKEIPTGLYVNP